MSFPAVVGGLPPGAGPAAPGGCGQGPLNGCQEPPCGRWAYGPAARVAATSAWNIPPFRDVRRAAYGSGLQQLAADDRSDARRTHAVKGQVYGPATLQPGPTSQATWRT